MFFCCTRSSPTVLSPPLALPAPPQPRCPQSPARSDRPSPSSTARSESAGPGTLGSFRLRFYIVRGRNFVFMLWGVAGGAAGTQRSLRRSVVVVSFHIPPPPQGFFYLISILPSVSPRSPRHPSGSLRLGGGAGHPGKGYSRRQVAQGTTGKAFPAARGPRVSGGTGGRGCAGRAAEPGTVRLGTGCG